ncbi:MAG: dihydropteroate synthase [Rhodocyclaceae bacterium]|nr:dihydropteroate synthase [Rhodocyclaceae bacterium]
MTELHCGKYKLKLDRPLVMGIVNLTPDSFSGDGLLNDVERAVAHARKQIEAGADILDLGAESSRPGAIPTPLQEELDRLLPVLERIVDWGVPISIDTYKPRVMAAALAAGADMINDITALGDPGALVAVADSNCGLCLMHMLGEPRTMQQHPVYGEVVAEVGAYLAERAAACRTAGIAAERIVVDPGFGFGKALEHNLALFRGLPALAMGGYPVLVGVSRKTMLGAITGRAVEERRVASAVAAVLAAQRGAAILRVHDVAETKDALALWSAVEKGR